MAYDNIHTVLRGWDPPPYDRSSVFSNPWVYPCSLIRIRIPSTVRIQIRATKRVFLVYYLRTIPLKENNLSTCPVESESQRSDP